MSQKGELRDDVQAKENANNKYTNPARGIFDFCKQKLWPLPCNQ